MLNIPLRLTSNMTFDWPSLTVLLSSSQYFIYGRTVTVRSQLYYLVILDILDTGLN